MTDGLPGNVVPLRRGVTSAIPTVCDLGDTVIDSLFAVGLHLQDVTPTADTAQYQHLRAALDKLDELIRTIRNVAFTTSGTNPARKGFTQRTGRQPSAVGSPVTSAGRVDGDVHELLDQSDFLHQRLHRVTVALAITQERIADAFDRLAATNGSRHEDYTLTAKRARASAAQCRDVVAQLEALPSY